MRQLILASAVHADGPDLIAANIDSRDFHAPWAQPFTDREGFEAWFERIQDDSVMTLVARLGDAGPVVGIVQFSQIFRGDFQNAYLSYYGTRALAGRGLMTRAVGLSLGHIFRAEGLNRIEANIQPGNLRSIALVKRLGFRLEGYSPAYLRIAGEWRDHERWALLARDWAQAEGAAL